MKQVAQLFSNGSLLLVKYCIAICLVASSGLASISCNRMAVNSQEQTLPADSVKFTLAYNESKQIKVGEATYLFRFEDIKVLFTEGTVDVAKKGITVRTTKVTLGINERKSTLMANGKIDEQGNQLPLTWTQLTNAPNYVVSVENILVGISDVYKDPSKTTYEEPNLLIDVIVKSK